MSAKKWLCVLFVLIMTLYMLPTGAMAAGAGEIQITGQQVDMATTYSSVAAGPALADGEHELWIDRIAALPDYASDFYDWLETNATATGALADPTKGLYADGYYIYMLHTIQDSAQFTYTNDAEMATRAQEAVLNGLGDQPKVIMNYAATVYGAFDRDHPEVFWLSGSSLCGYGISYTYYSNGLVTYTAQVYFCLTEEDFDIRKPDYRSTSAIKTAIEQRDSDVEEILADCPETDVYEQVRYLNRVLTERNAYNSAVAVGNFDAASLNAWECISALEGNSGTDGPVCEGYSRAFKVLCDDLHIPCVLVEGSASTNASETAGAHMWNYVQLDGNWYAVDTTWNDPFVSAYPDQVKSGYEGEDWLLLGSSTEVAEDFSFIESHVVVNKTTSNSLSYANGPVLSESAYDPSQRIVQPTITLKYPSLLIKDEVILAAYFTIDDATSVEEIGMLTWSAATTDISIDTAEAVIPGGAYDETTGYYRALNQGIPAKEMGDDIYLSIYVKLTDGSYLYTKQVSYSAKAYCYNQLSGTDEAVKPLLVALLNYGAAAQTIFGYKTDALVNADLTDEQKALVSEYSSDMVSSTPAVSAAQQGTFASTGTGFSRKYPSVSVKGAFAINYNFIPSATVSGDLTLYVWKQAAVDSGEVLTAENASETIAMTYDGSMYTASVSGIAAKNLDDGVYVAGVYTDADGNTHCTGVLAYSVSAYCASMAENTTDVTQPIAQAIAVYGYYARDYFAYNT